MIDKKNNIYYIFAISLITTLFLTTSCGKETQTPPEPTSTPFPEIDLNIELPDGDPDTGYLTSVKRGCYGCHMDEEHPEKGPRLTATDDLPNIFERGEVRITDPNYTGRATDNWEYVIESIRQPEIFISPGDWEKAMSFSIYNPITDEELIDIIAWIKSLE